MKTTLITTLLCTLLWMAGHAQQAVFPTELVAMLPKRGKVTKDKNSKMRAVLHDIHIINDVLYFRIGLRNGSHIRYDIDFIRFYIRDRKTAKRTVTQERDVMPRDIDGLEIPSVGGKGYKTIVAALDKFTLANGKLLVIEVYEKDGGRHLYLTVRNKDIENARPIR